MRRPRKSKPTYKTALSILDTFGPATAMHYLLLNQLHSEVLHEAVPDEFLDILKAIDQKFDDGGAGVSAPDDPKTKMRRS